MLFITDTHLDLARNDRSYPRDQIHSRLMDACDNHLSTTPERLHGLGSSSNLFVWNALIAELSLASALTDDERYLDHALAVVRSLDGEGWRTSSFDEHIHCTELREQPWGNAGIDRGRRFLETGVSPAGMTWEGLSYCGFVFKHLGAFIEGLRASARGVDREDGHRCSSACSSCPPSWRR